MTSLTALSSFPGSSRRAGDSRHNDSIGSSSKEFSLQSSLTPNTFGSKNEMIIRGSGSGQQQSVSTLEIYNQDGAESVNSEQQLALRIDKETKPHHHLLRLLKEMDPGDETSDPTKGEAVASLIGDFERDVSLIQQKIENEKLLKDSAENPPPLPANWIALECPQTGDIYYANEETGDTTWDRPGLDNEQNAYLNESAKTNDTGSGESNSGDENEDDNSYSDAGSLPPDWIALEDPDSGDTYYANEVTGETTWDRPESHQDDDEGDRSHLEHENERSNSSNTFTVQNEEESVSSSGHNDDDHNNSYNPQSLVSEEDGHNESYNLEQASSTDFNQSGQSSVEVDDDDENLPPGWYSAIDPDSNEQYYCNDETGESQWERPEFPVTDETSQGNSQHDDNHDESYNDTDDIDDDEEEEATGELPEGWEAILDPSTGDYYYYNWEDGTTTWDKPASDDSNQAQEQTVTENDNDLPEHWFAVDDPASGDTYYYNEVTNETSWDKPLIVYEEDSVTSSKY